MFFSARHVFKIYLILLILIGFNVVIGSQYSMADGFNPQLNGIVLMESRNDWGFDSESSDKEILNSFVRIEPYLILSLTDRLTLETAISIDQLKNVEKGDDLFLSDQTLVIEELKLGYFGDYFSVFGGKFNPSFGTAWDLSAGIYGKEIAKDYELRERIGGGASLYNYFEGFGEHRLTANTFFLDTSFLSGSALAARGEKDLSDGGVSNTEDLSSYSVTWDGLDVFDVKSLNTHLGYYNQSQGDADTNKENETGLAIGANYTVYLDKNIKSTLLAEWTQINNSAGGQKDIDYLTLSAKTKLYKQWNIGLAYTDKHVKNAGSSNENDYQFQLTGGYLFKNGFSMDGGYRVTDKDGKTTEALGALLAYTYEF